MKKQPNPQRALHIARRRKRAKEKAKKFVVNFEKHLPETLKYQTV